MPTVERDDGYIWHFLARVGRSWREAPDSRFCQFCSNVAGDRPLHRMSDEAFTAALDARDAWLSAQREEHLPVSASQQVTLTVSLVRDLWLCR